MPDRFSIWHSFSPAALLLLAAAALLLNAEQASAQSDSQRPLPLPPAAAAGSGTHLELLRRLRETLSQAEQIPPLPPQQIPAPGQPSSLQNTPAPAAPAAAPPSVALEDLMELGRALQRIAPQFPKELFPQDLLDRPPADLLSGFQHPDTQRQLQQMMQQFRKDGLMPQDPEDPSDDDAPTQTPDDRIPRTSLRSLDRFLREFQQNLPPQLAEDQTQQNETPRGPLRRRDATAPATEGGPRLLQPMPVPGEIPSNQNPAEPATDGLQRVPDQTAPDQTSPQNSPPTGNPRLGMPRGIESPSASPRSPAESAGPSDENSETPSETNPVPSQSAAQEPAATSSSQTPTTPQSVTPPAFGLSALQQLFQQFADPGQLPGPGSAAEPPTAQRPEETSNAEPETAPVQPRQQQSPPGSQRPAENSLPPSQDFSLREFIEQQLQDPSLRQRQQDWPAANTTEDPRSFQQNTPETAPPPERNLSEETAQSLHSRGLGSTLRDLMNQAREQADQPQTEDSLIAPLTDLFSAGRDPDTTQRPDPLPRQPRDPQEPGLLQKMRESVAGMLEELRPQIEGMNGNSEGMQQLSPEQLQELAQRMQLSPQEIEALVRAQGREDAANLPEPGSLQETGETVSTGDWSTAISSSLQLLALLGVVAAIIPLIRWIMRRRQQEEERKQFLLPAPESITATGDIVTAFHRLTRAAVRHSRPWWNHRQMSSELQQRFPQQQQSVQSLSGYYERARYQPRSAALNEADLLRIRMDLGSLIAARNAD